MFVSLMSTLATIDLERARNDLRLAERLASTPPEASVRGFWFSATARHVARLGAAERVALRRATGGVTRIPFRMYPVRDYLTELAAAAAIANPQDPAEGVRSIWRSGVSAYVDSPFGGSLVRLMRPNPVRYIGWLARHRGHFCDYGEWRMVEHSPGYVTMEMRDEYIWIETAHRGAAEGVLILCGVQGTVEPELETPYTGRLHVRWTPMA
jgi:uncharacterized protein (TIGR02265 family)